jgi:hypothetical protein
MNGQIAELVGGPFPRDREVVRDLFGQGFQSVAQWREFLRRYLLNGSVAVQLVAPASMWRVESFQALYVACWIHHPVEKGTFMIDLSRLTVQNRAVISDAFSSRLKPRPSSHLGGRGASASQGWAFLNGYHELLVQLEATKGNPYLMLKAEGHTTGLRSIAPHMASWVKKVRTGAGNTASPALHAYANLSPKVEGRAAENYAKGYEQLVGWVGLTGKLATVREVMHSLFKQVGYPRNIGHTYHFFDRSTNAELGNLLQAYVRDARAHGDLRRVGKNTIKDKTLNELENLARTLISDGAVTMNRVYREIRVTPQEIDGSIDYFCAQQDLEMPAY